MALISLIPLILQLLNAFLSYRKLLSYTIKSLRQDAHSREEEECRKRPRSARECAKAHSLFY